jgi:hypothetical protein
VSCYKEIIKNVIIRVLTRTILKNADDAGRDKNFRWVLPVLSKNTYTQNIKLLFSVLWMINQLRTSNSDMLGLFTKRKFYFNAVKVKKMKSRFVSHSNP